MQRLKAMFESVTGHSPPLPTPEVKGQIHPLTNETPEVKGQIHPLTNDPTKAWSMMQVKQKVETVTPLDPATPITDDKLRFVCLSDTHSRIEEHPDFVPPGDVILHAGDFTQVGAPEAIDKFNKFLGTLPHKAKLVIAGNHDLTLDTHFFNNQRTALKTRFSLKKSVVEDVFEEMKVKTSRELLTNCIYLKDSSVEVCGIKVHGSPWQPEFCDWAFNLPRGAPCQQKWDMIPDDTDVLITHGPPIGHGDLCYNDVRSGCVELLTTIQSRVKPKYHVFGHIHEDYGVTTDGHTVFVNASNVDLRYRLKHPAIVFDLPIPEGHSKTELENFPVNNLSENLD